MNKTQRNVNGGMKSIAKREWERKQAADKAAQAAIVKQKNAAALAAMVKGIK